MNEKMRRLKETGRRLGRNIKKSITLAGRIRTLERQAQKLKIAAAQMEERISSAGQEIKKRPLDKEWPRGPRQPLYSRSLPVFVRKDGSVAFRGEGGSRGSRVALLSIPKSGTYMYGEIFKELGFADSGVQGATWGFADLRTVSKGDFLADPGKYNFEMPLSAYIRLVRPGDYILTHMPCTKETEVALADFRKVLAVRQVRDCFISYMRYVARVLERKDDAPQWMRYRDRISRMEAFSHSDQARDFFNLSTPVVEWLDKPDVLLVRYEDFAGDNGQDVAFRSIEALTEHLDARCEVQLDLANIMGRDTVTTSGKRSRQEDWWNDEVEAQFKRLGGVGLNARLGYA